MRATCARAVQIGLRSLAFTEHADFTPWQLHGAEVPPGVRGRVSPGGTFLGEPLDVEGYLECLEDCRRQFRELRILSGERSVLDAGAQVLVVSQFTLYADVRKGRRPSWHAAAPAAVAEPLVEQVIEAIRERGVPVQTGVFGAHMRVGLVNDGPVTILVEA